MHIIYLLKTQCLVHLTKSSGQKHKDRQPSLRRSEELMMVAPACNPSTQEIEARLFYPVSPSPSRAIQQDCFLFPFWINSKDLKKHYPKDHTMPRNHIEKSQYHYTISCQRNESQNHRYHFILNRMNIILKTKQKIRGTGEDMQKSEPQALPGYKVMQTFWDEWTQSVVCPL